MRRKLRALSIRQPWATLLLCGLKTIEVRPWPTAERGWVLIHASGQEDERVEGWKRVPDSASQLAQLRGGIIGAAELVDCIAYRNRAAFRRDRRRHLNRPDWFQPAGLFGFVFQRVLVLPYRRLPGWVKFFDVSYADSQLPAALVEALSR
jgi:hypothetical protein